MVATNNVQVMDPLAQTFVVNLDGGCYLTKVGLFFASKPNTAGGDPNLPVTIELRPAVNGEPSSYDVIPDTTVSKRPSAVSTSTNATAETIFEFRKPVYIPEGAKAAIVVKTNAEPGHYKLFVARMGEFKVGSTTQRVVSQPENGAFFMSSNGTAWTSDQYVDLTYNLYRAEFSSLTATAVFHPRYPGYKRLQRNPFKFTAGDSDVYVSLPDHNFQQGDYVNFKTDDDGFDSATTINGILGSQILGDRPIISVDPFGFVARMNAAATSSLQAGGVGVLSNRQIGIDDYAFALQRFVPDNTSVSVTATMTTSHSLAAPAAEQEAYNFTSDMPIATNVLISLKEPHVVTTRKTEVLNLDSDRSTTFSIEMATTSSSVMPIIDLSRSTLITNHWQIDYQDSDSSRDGRNTPEVYVSETHPTNGTALAKHITPVYQLEDYAKGISVYVDVNRPIGTDFDLYYRTADPIRGDTNMDKQNWILASKVPPASNYNDLAPNTDWFKFNEYTFVIGGTYNSTIPQFDRYQLKIVMNSQKSTSFPRFRNLRTIALAD